MLLKISWQTPYAPDVTFLFHKHPDKVQSFDLPFGRAIVFYPALSHDHGEIALLVEIDPIGLTRRSGPQTAPLYPYVNDRPYVASSFLSVAVARVFGSALNGKSRDKPELIEQTFDFTIAVAPVVSNQGATLINSLFEPLGYEVRSEPHLVDEQFPAWGNSNYFSLTLRGRQTLSGMLGHLYVLIPALDEEKHYWVGEEEVEKLLRHGEHWLSTHPSRDLIVSRYLHRIRTLTQQALEQLIESPEPDTAAPEAKQDAGDVRLNQTRLEIVLSILKESGATRVLDLGCGEGRFLRLLLQTAGLQEIVGMDVSHRALELAAEKLQLASHSDAVRKRIQLIHGSLLYRDRRLEGFDAAVLIEVIEHLDPPRLAAMERVVFEFARPKMVVITTPNSEFNVRYPRLGPDRFRHQDHRFEWSRSQFQAWADSVAQRFGYRVTFRPIGPEDPGIGAPSQLAVFTQ